MQEFLVRLLHCCFECILTKCHKCIFCALPKFVEVGINQRKMLEDEVLEFSVGQEETVMSPDTTHTGAE